jgi:hypothetical protein
VSDHIATTELQEEEKGIPNTEESINRVLKKGKTEVWFWQRLHGFGVGSRRGSSCLVCSSGAS